MEHEHARQPQDAPAPAARSRRQAPAPISPAPVSVLSAAVLAAGARPVTEVGRADDPCEVQAEARAHAAVAALQGAREVEVAPVAPLAQGAIARLRRSADPVGASGGELDPDTDQELRAARSAGGRPLDPAMRRRLEPVMGADLSAVRLHEGPRARRLNDQVSAKAFTLGQDIFFRDGVPAPGTDDHLLAHELAHTIQQRSTGAISRLSRFYAVVDKPESGKRYDKVDGKPYEWIEDRFWDPQAYRVSSLRTGWKLYNLYERVPQPGTTDEQAPTEDPKQSLAKAPAPAKSPGGRGKPKRSRNRRRKAALEEAPEVENESQELEPEPGPVDGVEHDQEQDEHEAEEAVVPDDGLPKEGTKYTLKEARTKLAALHPHAPHPPANRKAAAAAWGRYILDELQLTLTQERKKKVKQAEYGNYARPGKVRETYKTKYDGRPDEFSASLDVTNVPEIVIHVHVDEDGEPKEGNAVHWKWADLELYPESFELSAKAADRFVSKKGANKQRAKQLAGGKP